MNDTFNLPKQEARPTYLETPGVIEAAPSAERHERAAAELAGVLNLFDDTPAAEAVVQTSAAEIAVASEVIDYPDYLHRVGQHIIAMRRAEFDLAA